MSVTSRIQACGLPSFIAHLSAKTSNMRMSIRAPLILFGLLTVLAVPLTAQSVSTTGEVRGRVLDAEQNAIPNVAVIARNDETGFQRETRTDMEGRYVIRLLPPGTYTVLTRAIGFRPEQARSVRVTLGQSSLANFALQQSTVELEEIVVTADAQRVDVSDGGVTQYVGQQEIQKLPSLGRDFVDFINLSGLVALDPGETTGGQFSIGGQRASQTSIQIDGVDANNAFFGENRGGSRIPFVFSLESIQELQIITNGFDVEHGSFSGGIINVITRGGTNEFEGSVYGNFRDDFLTSDPFIIDASDPEITTDYSVQQVGGYFSGPIIRDKAHFFLSADLQRRREPQLPLTRSRFDPSIPDNPNADPVVFAEMDQFFNILESQYGVTNAADGYRTFSTTNDALTLFGRVDWTINENHRLSVRHNFSTYANDNEWNGNFDFDYGLSRAEKIEDRSHSFVTELQSVLGENTYNVFRFQFSDEKRPRQGKDLRPALTVNLSNGQQARYGGTFASFNNNLEETKFQLINNLTHVRGDHTFKVGANLLFTNVLNQFQNFGSQFQGAGEFRFGSLADFQNRLPSSYFRPIQEGGGIPTSDFDVVEWAIYAQDEWQITPKLTATLGVRYDQQTFRDSPTPVVDVERAFGFETGFAPTDNNNISPRLALAYDLKGDGRSVARAGIGYFYGRVPYVVGGNVLQTERPLQEVICNGSILDGDPDAPPSVAAYGSWDVNGGDNPDNCASLGAGGVPTYTLWNQDFEFPETIKANLGYETLIGDRTQVSVDFIFSQSTNLYTVRNLNLRESQFVLTGEGGRRVFTPGTLFDPTGANSTGARRTLDFGDVLVNFNDGRARSYIATFGAQHRFNNNVNVSASYTFTKAYDNSPYSCCTASGGYVDPTTGVFGPNEIGGFGDSDNAWGISDFSREHAVVVSAFARLPWDFEVAAFWKSQSGRPWTVVGDDDLNGDGITGNDRLFVFAPADLPLQATGAAADAQRAAYAQILDDNSCVGDYVGEIIARNSCKYPWTHQLDLRITKGFDTWRGQRLELQADLFNVLNGLAQAFCGSGDIDGFCGLGRVTGIFGSNRELLDPRGFNATTGEIEYSVNENFGTEELLGSNLVLQFQAQLAFRYFF